MIKINNEIEQLLLKTGQVGLYTSQGACIGDDVEFIVVINEEGQDYLAHISEFEQKGVLVRLKNESK
jgi:hypothetical protein